MHVKNLLLAFVFSALVFNACKEKTEDPKPNVDCSTKNIVITTVVDSTIKCSSTGKITVSATGSTGFTFKLDAGNFQSGAEFKDLAEGSYTITAKDAEGCTKTANVTIGAKTTLGAKFTLVKDIITTKCNNVCHTSGANAAPKGIFTTDCDIVTRQALIKTKAVDDVMGGLNSTEKQQITDWINAGGTIAD